MQPRVTAIIVARAEAHDVEAVRAALEASTRPPDEIVLVPDWEAATQLSDAAAAGREWLWMLTADTIPLPTALAALLAAVEVAPSVVIAGPKLVLVDDPSMIVSFGESLTRYGTTVSLVDGELDQAQHDRAPDVLGVAREGMLVRRDAFDALGGFDPGLPIVDGGLDLAVRARLAGHRVVRVAAARVARRQRPEDVGRSRPARLHVRTRIARRAQLHRRLVWAPPAALPFHWLSLLPLALARSLWRLLAKRPDVIGGEIAAAVGAAVDRTVPRSRRQFARTRRAGWAAIAPLRVPPAEVRRRRAAEHERRAEARGISLEIRRARFVPGGFSVVLIGAALSAVVNWRLLGATEIGGGALRPLAESPAALWSSVLGERGTGLVGWVPADPFSVVLSALGSLTFWDPSFALVLLWLLAMPLAALCAWWAATRLSERAWPPVVAAIAWMIAPPLLVALADGRPAAVVVHLLLPWLALAVIDAQRSWGAAGGGALLFAGIVAASPSLAPALTAALVITGIMRPRASVRTLGVAVLGLAALAPVLVVQVLRGTPLAAFADPGMPLPVEAPAGWELLLGIPQRDAASWGFFFGDALPPLALVIVSAAMLAPLAVLAVLAVFVPGSSRAIPALVLALLGLTTAVGATMLVVDAVGAAPVTPWAGAGLSLAWLGLLAAAVVALDTLRPAAAPLSVVLLLGAAAAVAPTVAGIVLGSGAVTSDARVVPAIIEAEASSDPGLGTLVLRSERDGSVVAHVERGAGTTLESFSTLESTAPPTDVRRAELVANLVSFGAYDATAAFEAEHIRFVLVPVEDGASPGEQRIIEGLDASPELQAIGETDAGVLWRTDVGAAGADSAPRVPPVAVITLAALGGLLLITVLLALPTGPRRRVVEPSSLPGDDPADTFDEDDNA